LTDVTVHPLAVVLDAAIAGTFRPSDEEVEVLPPDASGRCAVVAMTGHAYVLADVDRVELSVRGV